MAMEADKQDRRTSSTNPLDSLVLQKEKEWRDAFQLRIQTLQATLREREKELKNEKIRFRKLKEDFEYNLRLLEERDEELEKYDATFGKAKQAENAKAAEVSELLVNIDELKLKLENEVQAREELQKHYQKRLKDYQNEMKNFRQEKENEVNKEREELSSHRRNLESQLREVEDDFEFRRQELVSHFDEVTRKREHEFLAKLDETSGLLLANDLKVRTLTKELELVRSTSGHCKEELKNSEVSAREFEKELKEKEWMIADLQNTHNFKVADMDAQMINMKSMQRKLQEDFQRKHAELDRLAREREEMLLNTKQGFSEQESKLVEKIRELQAELETKSQEHRQKKWSMTDKLKEHEVTVQRLQESIANLQSTLESQRQESTRATVAKDVELEALQQQEAKLRTEVAQRKEELARRQKELTLSLEREAAQERSRVQLELDWQRRCEDGERIGFEKQEELVKSLTQGKQEAFSLVKQQKRELLHKDSLLRILTAQRDESAATLTRHGLSVPVQIPTKGTAISMDGTNIPETVQIEDVQMQNENLLQVIHQMRTDMEDLTTQLLQHPHVTTSKAEMGAPITPEYVDSLEKEVRDLKAKIRDLPHTLVGKGNEKPTEPAAVVIKSADPYIRGHVKELNDTIGYLRQEKLELTSQVRKCEATIVHIQGVLNQCSEEARQKQVTIEQLKYQLTTLSRRTEEELSSWKQRNTDLSLQVAQARQEADEFYKNGLERNVDAVSLGNQLSALKLDLASQGKTANFYNPEVHVVRQLEEEIQSLRKQLNKVMLFDSGVHVVPQGKTGVLQRKLHEAAERINALVREREQLIKMGNKMRAELMKMKGADESKKPPQTPPQSPPSHLQALEQLQYQLTARELQYAQRGLVRDYGAPTTATDADPLPDPRNLSVAQKPVTALPENRETSSSRDEKEVSPWQPSFSSDGRSSLQEVWKLLDEDSPGFTPRGLRGDDELSASPLRPSRPPDSSSAAESFTVRGEASKVQPKRASLSGRRVLSEKAAGRWKPSPAKDKVRNYNMKDNEI